MTFFGWCAAISGAWIVLATVSTTGWCLLASRRKRRDTRPPSYPPPVRSSLYKIPDWARPPVPPVDPLEDWYRDMPADILTDAEIVPLFDDIVRGEFA